MGRIRGKRNRDQDRYWHERRKATQAGMIGADDVVFCARCGYAVALSDMVSGWCLVCMQEWRATADPVMLAQAAAGYSPANCLPAPSERDVTKILEAIIAPKIDNEFWPLLLFRGGRQSLGRMQALWNFLKTMEVLELKSTGEVLRLSQASHDLVHRCGLHAPVQRLTLTGFMSRVLLAENFKPLERDNHLRDYIRWFTNTNRMMLMQLTRVTAVAEWKTTRDWRRFPKLRHKPMTEHWPFLHKESAKDHLDIMMVDSLVPKGIPEQWRQDMCQDLFVAVLSGEIEPDRLHADAKHYIKKIWKQHPYKYGLLSLDGPAKSNAKAHETHTMLDILADISIDPVEHSDSILCCDEHRPSTLSTLGDVLREKNNGVALPDVRIEYPEEMDEDVYSVYQSEIARNRSGYGLTRLTESAAYNQRTRRR